MLAYLTREAMKSMPAERHTTVNLLLASFAGRPSLQAALHSQIQHHLLLWQRCLGRLVKVSSCAPAMRKGLLAAGRSEHSAPAQWWAAGGPPDCTQPSSLAISGSQSWGYAEQRTPHAIR